MPPTITLEQVTGLGLFIPKVVLSRRGDEIIDLAKIDLFRLAATTPAIKARRAEERRARA
jgi:hypothetical protein